MAEKILMTILDNGDIQFSDAETKSVLYDSEELLQQLWERSEYDMAKKVLASDERIDAEMKTGANLSVLVENYLQEKYNIITTMHDYLIRLAFGTINEEIMEEITHSQINDKRNEDERLMNEFNNKMDQV